MEVDLNEIDNRLSQIVPDGSQEQGTDAKSAEDDLAIAEAINQIEEELQHERRSIFKPEELLSLDLNDIDSNLKQIPQSIDDFTIHSSGDVATAEDDLAIADAIHEVESELKQKEKSVFNPTTVVMLLIAGGIVTSRIASMMFSQ